MQPLVVSTSQPEVSVMAAPAHILKDIHRLKRHIKDLETKLEQGPKAHKAHQLKVASAEDALHKAQDGLKQLKVTIHEKEVSIKAAQQGIEKPLVHRAEHCLHDPRA